MLKNTAYPGHSGRLEGEVAYLVVDHVIFFSALTITPSSINLAERIILMIAEAEEIHWSDYRFVDIQTHRGYSRRQPGEYETDQLVTTEGVNYPQVTGWTRYVCPNEVIEAFRHLIN